MITNYKLFLENIENDISISDYHILIKNVDTEEISFNDYPFHFNISKYQNDYTLELLKENPDFNDNLSKQNFFISEFINTMDFDTHLLNDIKYLLIHKKQDLKMNKLEKLGDPSYIIFQTKKQGKWLKDNISIYKINDKFNNFYNNLNSKTIEISDNNNNYIYTSNGNNWILKNIENESDTFKKIITNTELKNILSNKNYSLNII